MLGPAKTIWNTKCLSKVRTFFWPLAKEASLTWDNLLKKGWVGIHIDVGSHHNM